MVRTDCREQQHLSLNPAAGPHLEPAPGILLSQLLSALLHALPRCCCPAPANSLGSLTCLYCADSAQEAVGCDRSWRR